MGKSAKKQKNKEKKRKKRDLVDRLRSLGLPEQSARNVAETVTNVHGRLPDSARSAISELISTVDDLRARGSHKGTPGDGQTDVTASDDKIAKKQAKKARKKKARKKAKATKAKPA